MSTLMIKNPLLIATMNDRREEIHGGHILVRNDVIESLGPDPLDTEVDEVIDARGMVVLPGFINTHHHLYQSLTRNIPRMQNLPLFGWLSDHYELWRELTVEAVHISAQTALLELMKTGTSTSSDHLYIFPKKTSGALIDAEIMAAEKVGIRFQPTRGSMSLGRSNGGLPPDDIIQSEEEIQEDIERLVARYHDDSDGAMLRISLAPCSPFSVTPELMKATVEYARENNLRIHTHLSETLDEVKFCIDTFGMPPVQYLESLGWLTEFSWFAHAVQMEDEDILKMGASGSGVSHCPSSNMRLGSGIARIKEMRDAGVKISLGVDGTASNDSGNMLAEIRNAMLLSRLRDEPYWLTARDVLWFATRGGADVLGRNDIGQLSRGKRADMALFSIQDLEYAGGQSDPLGTLVFTVRMSPVDYLIVNGNIQVRERQTILDEEALIQSHNRLSADLLHRAGKNTGIDFSS